jgi:4-hydroxy-3-methylbut-2-enyl diphosphate reductase IspH
MKYKQLTQQYRDDTLAEAMYGREVEYFHYEFDSVNFTTLLKTLPDGAERDSLQERLTQTLVQMDYVDKVYQALEAQITDQEAHEAAIVRTTQKRKDYVPAK